MGIAYNGTDNAFGFVPHGPVLRARVYAVNTAPTINVCVGDLVVAGGAIVSTPKKGYLMDIADAAVPDGSAGILGAVLGCFDETFFPVNYIAAGEVGNSTIAGYILVADHPYQEFIAQEDGTTNAIDLAEGGQNADIISATLCAPNTTTYLSTQEIDSDTAGTAAALQVKLIRPHEDDTPADDSNPNARWICQINEHFYGSTIAGV